MNERLRWLKALCCATAAAALLAGTAGCGSSAAEESGSSASSAQYSASASAEEADATSGGSVSQGDAVDLSGTWVQNNSDSDETWMEAEISGDTIEVYWIGTDLHALYWKGSYVAPTSGGDYEWTSVGDTDEMSSALLASSDDTKTFYYSESDGVSFDATILDTTVRVTTARE